MLLPRHMVHWHALANGLWESYTDKHSCLLSLASEIFFLSISALLLFRFDCVSESLVLKAWSPDYGYPGKRWKHLEMDLSSRELVHCREVCPWRNYLSSNPFCLALCCTAVWRWVGFLHAPTRGTGLLQAKSIRDKIPRTKHFQTMNSNHLFIL